jgi:hypothetical protein
VATQLADQRRLTGAGWPAQQDELRAAIACALDDRRERVALELPPVELVGDLEQQRRVVLGERELWCGTGEAGRFHPLEVTCEAECAAIAVFRGLGQQLHDDGRERRRQRRLADQRRDRFTRDVTVDHRRWIGRLERWRAGEQLIQGRAERVEVGAVIDGAAGAPGLLR